MKRLLFILCCLIVVQELSARKPVVRFDLPYTLEHGKYIVLLETPVGPRRFIFDTGCPVTVITESLRDEMGLETVRSTKLGDFEGHKDVVSRVRLDSIRMGQALFRNLEAVVMPDSSMIFPCFKVEGIAGSDLLQEFAVRMPNADSTITFVGDIRAFGKMDRRYSTKMYSGGGCPHIAVENRNGKTAFRVGVRFDTGSAGYYDYSLRKDSKWIESGFAENLRWTEGFSSNMGWTNRSAVKPNFVGVVPSFTVAGTTFTDMPMGSTYGGNDILGCKVLDWGQVVMDFPGKRFWFLPYEDEQPVVSPRPVFNFTPWMSAGELVVGQIWDETLLDVIAPGDRILTVDGKPWVGDICEFMFNRGAFKGATCQIETADGSRVSLTIKKL